MTPDLPSGGNPHSNGSHPQREHHWSPVVLFCRSFHRGALQGPGLTEKFRSLLEILVQFGVMGYRRARAAGSERIPMRDALSQIQPGKNHEVK